MKLRFEQREPVQRGFDQPDRGWLLYDADCSFCRRWAERVRAPLAREGFAVTPLQEAWVRAYFDEMSEGELLAAVRVLRRDGRHFAGGDAVMHLSRYVWWLLPLWLAAHLPPLRSLIRAVYAWVSHHRDWLR